MRAPHHRHLEKNLGHKLDFLSRPQNYPETTEQLVTIETHMAWVFLTDRFAYKLKKPVFRLDQDYSTIDARYRDNRIELRLNQHFAKDTYLDVEALRVNHRGEINLAGEGNACDWLLKMRRLPGQRMLDRLLGGGDLNHAQIESIGRHLGQFYGGSEPVAISFSEYKNRFLRGIEANEQILAGEDSLKQRIQTVGKLQVDFVNQYGELLDDSLRCNRVIECHGDLRPEHVCVEAEIRIIDCLQFCRDYRLMDYFDDAGFLALECERMGYPHIGGGILAAVASITGSSAPHPLIHFYQCYRASIRARLALLHLVYRSSNNRQLWLGHTESYLALAEAHIRAALQN